jgi:hypothetical protein
MSSVSIDSHTGALLVGADKHFPIGLSNPPPPGSKTPAGRNGLEEVAASGISFVRTGIEGWNIEFADQQIAEQKRIHAAIAEHGLRTWLWLGNTPNFPARAAGKPPSTNEQLMTKLVTAFRSDPALLAWKAYDEPRNPARGARWIRPAGLVRAHEKLKALDPHHPAVIIQAPRGRVADLIPYRPAFDITGIDIYPVAYPPGLHAGGTNRDISVVGQMARKARQAAGKKPFWMTLQIAWSGMIPTRKNPGVVPRYPTFLEERFMAYQAIVNGARGLNFFGGHITSVMTPDDAADGWNWTFWRRALRPVVSELASRDLRPALVAADAGTPVKTRSADIELVTRRTATHLYVIAVRTGGSVSKVGFTGVPAGIRRGEVLFEYVQDPLPPARTGKHVPRPVTVAGGAFSDWFAPHDAHVYRFAL